MPRKRELPRKHAQAEGRDSALEEEEPVVGAGLLVPGLIRDPEPVEKGIIAGKTCNIGGKSTCPGKGETTAGKRLHNRGEA